MCGELERKKNEVAKKKKKRDILIQGILSKHLSNKRFCKTPINDDDDDDDVSPLAIEVEVFKTVTKY